jgi:hypothetical protein
MHPLVKDVNAATGALLGRADTHLSANVTL